MLAYRGELKHITQCATAPAYTSSERARGTHSRCSISHSLTLSVCLCCVHTTPWHRCDAQQYFRILIAKNCVRRIYLVAFVYVCAARWLSLLACLLACLFARFVLSCLVSFTALVLFLFFVSILLLRSLLLAHQIVYIACVYFNHLLLFFFCCCRCQLF